MEINGLPLHPLAVHGAVVLAPLAALVALAYLRPVWRDRLRWPMVALAVLAAALIWASYLTGVNFRSSDRFAAVSGTLADRIQTHQNYARQLRWVASAFGVVAVLAAWLHTRTGAVRVVLAALLGVSALAVGVLVFLTGESGARSVWGQ
jgi:Ca2+/Na+ antiporter